MIPDGYLPPLHNTEDIPIQREIVGGMGMNTVLPPFKPYVYRGIGSDLYEMPRPQPWPEVPKPQQISLTDKRKREVARLKRVAKARQDYDLAIVVEAAREARRVLDITDTETWGSHPKPVKVKRKKAKSKKHRKPLPRSVIPTLPVQPRKPRPSPGWQPMTGDDLEAAWVELEEE